MLTVTKIVWVETDISKQTVFLDFLFGQTAEDTAGRKQRNTAWWFELNIQQGKCCVILLSVYFVTVLFVLVILLLTINRCNPEHKVVTLCFQPLQQIQRNLIQSMHLPKSVSCECFNHNQVTQYLPEVNYVAVL